MSTARASEWDKEYMRRIGRYKAESHRLATEEHLRRPPNERLMRSFAWARANYGLPSWSRRDTDNPGAIYEVAKRIGCYRP
ncbi:MAG TPA: hypothetical protein VJQ83_12580 [Tepidiformaceae bacterium]|nr:hypothetical protein [Tepidiformaceae bacterium]